VDDTTLSDLIEALKNNSTLTSLDLLGTITNNGADQFASFLKDASSLSLISLSFRSTFLLSSHLISHDNNF